MAYRQKGAGGGGRYLWERGGGEDRDVRELLPRQAGRGWDPAWLPERGAGEPHPRRCLHRVRRVEALLELLEEELVRLPLHARRGDVDLLVERLDVGGHDDVVDDQVALRGLNAE